MTYGSSDESAATVEVHLRDPMGSSNEVRNCMAASVANRTASVVVHILP